MSETDYSTHPARYAKGQLLIRCPSTTGYKTRAARLIEGLKGRWTNREHGYVLSPTKLTRFEKLYAEGWDASIMTGELQSPKGK